MPRNPHIKKQTIRANKLEQQSCTIEDKNIKIYLVTIHKQQITRK